MGLDYLHPVDGNFDTLRRYSGCLFHWSLHSEGEDKTCRMCLLGDDTPLAETGRFPNRRSLAEK